MTLVVTCTAVDAVPVTTHHQPPPSRAQLHEQACIHCGGEEGELVPAGHFPLCTRKDRAPLGWPVVAHPACIAKESLMHPDNTDETIDPQELRRIEASFDEMRAHIQSPQPTTEVPSGSPEAEQ
jgi:hypothetical protein